MIEPTFSSAAPVTAAPATPAPEEDVTTALYRAAIGPVNGNYYLPIFTRFEAADHAGISWNTAASLTTLNWLAFRQLWTAALAYVGIIVAVALLVFGIGRLVFQFSDTLVMALGLGFGLAAFVLPGLFGNAVLHAACRKKMSSALTAHTQVEDACAQLTRQAPTRQRAIWLASASAAFWMVAVFAYVQISALSNVAVMPHGALEAGHVAVGKTTDLTVAPAVPSAPATVASAATAAASAPSAAPSAAMTTAFAASASTPSAPAASAPVTAASTALPVSAPAPVASAPITIASQPVVAAPIDNASAPARAAKPEPKASASKTAHKASAPARAERDKKATEPEPTVVRAKKAQPPTTTETPKRKASATATATADVTDKPYFINVGLFAIPENAASAHAKLLEAQLPSVLKELKSTKGRQIRVRVGPYRSKADAQAAAEKIKALQLDAVIVQP